MTEPQAPTSELVLYQTEDARTKIQCRFEAETIWLPQRLIAELFAVTVPTVHEHISGIYAEGELAPEATIRKVRIVRTEGNRSVARDAGHYSLPLIIAVGFRVRSAQGTAFRRWANERISFHRKSGARDHRCARRFQCSQHGAHQLEGSAVRKADVTVAKNYLNEAEIEELNRIVVMFLDYAEDQARPASGGTGSRAPGGSFRAMTPPASRAWGCSRGDS